MPDFSLTPAQHDAIYADGGSLLVSAAAGSGKTAVLTRRVTRILCDETLQLDPARLVVVTFTRSATAEMKQRIRASIAQQAQLHPGDPFYQRQLLLLGGMKLSTIDALCQQLVKEQFQQLGISSRFRVGEERELNQMAQDCLDQMLEQRCKEQDPAYTLLADTLCRDGEGRLEEAVEQLWDFLDSYPFPQVQLEGMLDLLRSPSAPADSPWGKALLPMLVHRAGELAQSLEQLQPVLEDDALFGPASVEGSHKLLLGSRKLVQALEQENWEQAVALLRGLSGGRCTPRQKKADRSPELEQALERRKQVLEQLKELQTLLCCTGEEFAQDLDWLRPRMEALGELCRDFTRRLDAQKEKNQVYSFSDLTRMAVQLLVRREGEEYVKTDLGRRLSEEYYAVMVDECQDISAVQNLLFWGLAKGPDRVKADSGDYLTGSQNLFLVGDVKQSIYRFRRATPELFVRRGELYRDYQKEKAFPGRILLSHNFRSRKQVCDGVNLIFSRSMTKQFGDLDYTSQEWLNPGAAYPDAPGMEAELCLVEETEAFSQADYIARRIRAMLDQGFSVSEGGRLRPCRPGDFCVLLRSTAGAGAGYRRAFEQAGVPLFASQQQGYFDSYEVAVILELLRVLDNPLLDVSMAAVLLSPMVGYTPAQLAALRSTGPEQPLYRLLLHRQNQQDQAFLSLYRHLRMQAAVLEVDRLLRLIYDTTGFYYMVAGMEDGRRKGANLQLLIHYAQDYQSGSHRGLGGFVRYLDRAIQRQERFECANIQTGEAVQLMTIHKSKGLEYPICFVAGLEHRFNQRDLQRTVLLHGQLGMAMPVIRPEKGQRYDNLPLVGVRQAIRRENQSEELRVLYVALTRAKEKLILVGSAPGEESLSALAKQGAGTVSPYDYLSKNCALDWLLLALARQGSFRELQKPAPKQELTLEQLAQTFPEDAVLVRRVKAPKEQEQPETARQEIPLPDPALEQKLAAQMAEDYPFAQDTRLPAKLSVTQLVRRQTGQEELEPFVLPDAEHLTAAQRGTATHRVLELCRLSALAQNPEGEIARLVEDGLLTPQEGESVNRRAIRGLFASPVGQWLTTARAVHREYPFLCDLSAQSLETGKPVSGKGEQSPLLLQGVVDLILEWEDEVKLIDYKTDRVTQPEELVRRYATQLACYKLAVEEYLGKPVTGSYLYSFGLGKLVEV